MPNPSATFEATPITIANGQAASDIIAIGNPTELGLLVPTLTSSTLKVQVGRLSDGSDMRDIYDATGTQKLTYGAGTGNFAISTNEMGACLAYPYIKLVCGSSQGAARTFYLMRKVVGADVTA